MKVPWPRPTVRLRLTLTYTALFVVTGTALLGVNYFLVQHREGAATAAGIICRPNAQPNLQTQSGIPPEMPVGTPLPGPAGAFLDLSPEACSGAVGAYFYHSSGNESGKIITSGNGQPVQISGPTAAAVQQLTTTVKISQSHTLDTLRTESAVALGLITILSFGLSWWMAGRVLRPVHRITDAARRLSEQTLDNRINLQGPNDELKELADTFDAMLARLGRAFESQRRFVANASHELRTPLATERVLIDEALANRSAEAEDFRAILEQLRTNSQETERLVEALLTLARSERAVEHWADVDLATTTQSVLAGIGPEATSKGIEIRSELAHVSVAGDPGLVERLVGNVVENAVRHNVPGGWVDVITRSESNQAVLEVANTGSRLDDADIPTLTEPFRRAGSQLRADDGGFGIGLSVVEAVVHAHRGTLSLRSRSEGGLVVQVRLPSLPIREEGANSP